MSAGGGDQCFCPCDNSKETAGAIPAPSMAHVLCKKEERQPAANAAPKAQAMVQDWQRKGSPGQTMSILALFYHEKNRLMSHSELTFV